MIRSTHKVMICGSREYSNLTQLHDFIQTLPQTILIIHGGAAGVDSFAGLIAKKREIEVKVVEPDWKPNGIYNPRAGFERNKLMVDEADVVVAFWNGVSKGTLDSITHAVKQDKLFAVYLPSDDLRLPCMRGVKW